MKIELCPWCNKKSVGVDETGFKSCVHCEYNSDEGVGKYKLSNDERHKKGMRIYHELVCSESNDDVPFICLCNKLKGHKHNHRSSEHPDYTWGSGR